MCFDTQGLLQFMTPLPPPQSSSISHSMHPFQSTMAGLLLRFSNSEVEGCCFYVFSPAPPAAQLSQCGEGAGVSVQHNELLHPTQEQDQNIINVINKKCYYFFFAIYYM